VKIGMVSEFFYPQPGGISEHIRALSRELRLRGHEVTVITSHIHGKVAERDPRVVRIGRSQPIRYNGAVSRFTWGSCLRRKMRAALETGGFDVLHVHNPHQPILPLVALSQTRCPAVGTFHSNNPGDLGTTLLHPLMRPLVNRLDVRLAVSPTARWAASRHYPGRYEIVPNGVDYSFFSEAAGEESVFPGLDPGKKKILFVGALVRRKGLPYLLRAFSLLRQQRRDIELVVVGDGHGRRRMQKFLPEELSADVHFVGSVPRVKLADYYASADVFCAPSTGQESFGMVLLEAMAAGLPVVSFDIDGYNDVMEHGREGLLVQPRSIRGLADALAYCLDSEDERARFAAEGRVKARAHDWSEIARHVEKAYRKARGEPEQMEMELAKGQAAGS